MKSAWLLTQRTVWPPGQPLRKLEVILSSLTDRTKEPMKWRACWLGCLVVFAAGCGYLKSGTWEDDPANWKRAFRSVKPDDVVVVHSRYWRSPHWSYEAAYVFEIAPNAELRQQLFDKNRLVRLDEPTAEQARRLCFPECPVWFAPRSSENHEVWGYEDGPPGNFRVLIDRDTGTLFLTDFHV